MIKNVPLHSLVIAIGPSAVSREALLVRHFPAHEMVSARAISRELVGECDRPDLNSIVFSEVRRRAMIKLDLGERVVIDAANLRREDRISLARVGFDAGVDVYYLVCDPSGATIRELDRFQSCEHEIMSGDGMRVGVIDGRVDQPFPLTKEKPSLDTLRREWNGVTVVGDIHGMRDSLMSVIAWAQARRHYLMFLGDVIDYGPKTLEVADDVYRLVMTGQAEIILGNHERKISRWIADRTDQRLSDGNRVTTEALSKLGALAARQWQGRFRGLVARASIYRELGNTVFAHAAIHPDYWVGTASPRDIENMALFGEFTLDGNPNHRPSRTYAWVDSIPHGKTAIVGHDIRSTRRPLAVLGVPGGGTAVFMDTGSGKGGRLSSADLKFTEDGFRIENFNLH